MFELLGRTIIPVAFEFRESEEFTERCKSVRAQFVCLLVRQIGAVSISGGALAAEFEHVV